MSYGVHHLFFALTGKPENNMCDDVCSCLFEPCYSFIVYGRLIASVDEFCRIIVRCLKPKLDIHRDLFDAFRDHFQYLFRKAVRSCSYGKRKDLRVRHRFVCGSSQFIRFAICVREALEISDIARIVACLLFDERDGIIYLTGNALISFGRKLSRSAS